MISANAQSPATQAPLSLLETIAQGADPVSAFAEHGIQIQNQDLSDDILKDLLGDEFKWYGLI